MSNDLLKSNNMNSESIKEKLHLHVKRRIKKEQESSGQVQETPPLPAVSITLSPGTNTSSAHTTNPSYNVRKQLFPNEKETSTSLIAINPPTLMQKSPKKNKSIRKNAVVDTNDYFVDGINSDNGHSITQSDIEPPPSTAAGSIPNINKNPINSNNNNIHGDLDEKCNSVLGIILNEKKNLMMRDPKVIKFLQNIYNRNDDS